MTDITFEVGPVAGDDVTFEVGPAAGDDVSFDIPVPGGGGVDLPISSDDVTVPTGTMPFIEEFYTPATDSGTDHLNAVDQAVEAAGGGIFSAFGAITALDTRVEAAEDGIADLTSRNINAGTGLTGGGSLDADRTLAVTYGTTAGTAAQGNDARLSDARTPTAHQTSHATGGGDALAPSDIGAVPTSRAISTTAPLTGGGDLSADRTLAITTGLTTDTVVEGIALPRKPWRTGSYYGIDLPIANSGTAMASGAVRAMPFYNPVAGRAIDQLALDVFSASSSPAAYLYICTDDGTGYPGAVVASNSITPAALTRLTASVTYTLPRGLLWFVAHSTAVTWAGLNFSNLAQSPYLPMAASYSANGMSCWLATGAGTSALTSFPAGANPSASGLQFSVRAA